MPIMLPPPEIVLLKRGINTLYVLVLVGARCLFLHVERIDLPCPIPYGRTDPPRHTYRAADLFLTRGLVIKWAVAPDFHNLVNSKRNIG